MSKPFIFYKFMKTDLKKHIVTTLLFMAAGACLFRNLLIDTGIWNYADASFPMDTSSMDYLLNSIKGVWWNRNFLGYDTTFQTIIQASYILTWKALYELLGDFSVMQFTWYVLIFTISCVSMFSLTNYFFKDQTAAFVSGLFYGINPWIIDRMFVPPIYQAYAFIPALFLFYALFITRKESKNAIYFAICSFFIIASPHYTYYAAILISLYSLFYFYTARPKIPLISYLKNNSRLAIITFSVLGFYSIPLIYSFLINQGGSVTKALENFSKGSITAFHYGKELKIYNSIRLLGFHDSLYKNLPFWITIFTFLLPLISTIPLLLKKHAKNKIYLFLYTLMVIGIFLSSSTNLLNKITYKYILLNLPIINTLAKLPDPHYHEFLIAFAYGPIFALSIMNIFSIISNLTSSFSKKILKVIVLLLFILTILITGYPLLKWNDPRYKQFSYPEEYSKTASFLQKNSSKARTYVLPASHSIKHNWAPYFISNLDKFILNVDTFGSSIKEATPHSSLKFMSLLTSEAVRNPLLITYLLKFANTKHILAINDAKESIPYVPVDGSTLYLLENFGLLEGISPEKRNRYFTIYKLDENYFLPHIYAASSPVYITSGIKSFSPLTSTDYLNGSPALIFIEEQKHIMKSLLKTMPGQILAVNGTYYDIITSLLDPPDTRSNSRSILEKQLKIDKEGVYDILIKLQTAHRGETTSVTVDKNNYTVSLNEAMADNWIKALSKNFKKGRHMLSANGATNATIISKNASDEIERSIKTSQISYLFHTDPDKAVEIATQTEKTGFVMRNLNPLKTKSFYIPNNGNYSINAHIKPRRNFIYDQNIASINSVEFFSNIASDWEVLSFPDKVNEIRTARNEDGLYIKWPLINANKSNKTIILEKRFNNVILKENPILVLNYSSYKPAIQDIFLEIYLSDKNRTNSSNKLLVKLGNNISVIDIYEKAKRVSDKINPDTLYISSIRISLNKKVMSVANNILTKEYGDFTLKHISFINFKPILIDTNDILSDFKQKAYYYYDIKGNLQKTNSVDTIPDIIKNIYMLQIQDFQDLKKSPILTLTLPKLSYSNHSEDIDFPYALNVFLKIDLNGDLKEDAQTHMVLTPAMYNNTPGALINISAFDKVSKEFPDSPHYNLLGISIQYKNGGPDSFYYKISSKQLVRFNSHHEQLGEFDTASTVSIIDNKSYVLSHSEKDGQSSLNFNSLKLSKGYHTISIPENDKFKVNIIEIKSDTSRNPPKPPQTNFKRINASRYTVDVKATEHPFVLVFNESFHNGWKAYIRRSNTGEQPSVQAERGNEWSALWSAWIDKGKKVEVKNHFIVNGYANGWMIPGHILENRRKRPGIKSPNMSQSQEFQIIIEYIPQRFFETGLILSIITLLACIGYIGLDLKRKRVAIEK